jgi:hypothetical protein
MSNHLSAQGRLDPKGGLHCVWCENKTWTPSIGIFDAPKMVKNRLELRKLWPLLVERVKNTKKQTTEHYKADTRSPKKTLSVALLVLEFKDEL